MIDPTVKRHARPVQGPELKAHHGTVRQDAEPFVADYIKRIRQLFDRNAKQRALMRTDRRAMAERAIKAERLVRDQRLRRWIAIAPDGRSWLTGGQFHDDDHGGTEQALLVAISWLSAWQIAANTGTLQRPAEHYCQLPDPQFARRVA